MAFATNIKKLLFKLELARDDRDEGSANLIIEQLQEKLTDKSNIEFENIEAGNYVEIIYFLNKKAKYNK